MHEREFKYAMYGGLTRLLKAIANASRLEIIELLAQGEKSVEGIVQSTGLTFANASQHLQVMKNNNLVTSRKDGHYVYYSLISDEFLALYQQVITYAVGEMAELERLMNRQREHEVSSRAVTLDELERMIGNEGIMLLDVRPSDEFAAGHITGAVSAPLNDLLKNLKGFSAEQEIIAYCRGPFCVLADEAVKILKGKGFRVRRLSEGYPEWKVRQLNHHQKS